MALHLLALFAGLASNGTLHKAAVKGDCMWSSCHDRVSRRDSSVVDEANDVAEARREGQIDAAVRARLAELEEGVSRAENLPTESTQRAHRHNSCALQLLMKSRNIRAMRPGSRP